MTRHLGRISLVLAIVAWAIYLGALLVGGIDPPPRWVPVLKLAVAGTSLLALSSAALAVVALVRGPQRVAAGLALAVALVFLSVFTGAFFWLFAWR